MDALRLPDKFQFSAILVASLSLAGAYALFLAARFLINGSPVRYMPGPPKPNWLLGNFRQLRADAEDGVIIEQWAERYGHVFTFSGLFSMHRVLTTDLKAINHVLTRADVFEKPILAQRALAGVFGNGLLVSEGDAHRAQRRVMNPAFGPGHVRDLTGIFLDKANELRDVWLAALEKVGTDGRVRVDALHDFTNATLDIIGLAGFGYEFGALSRPSDSPSELSTAFSKMFTTRGPTIWGGLTFMFPVLRNIPTQQMRDIAQGRRVLDQIGEELLAQRKAQVADEKAELGGRDLLSRLVRANMAESAAQRLPDKLVIAQIPTFMLAGHETTSTALAWTVYALSQHPSIQTALREELRTLPLPRAASGCEPLDQETLAALDKLPLLDAVVRETLRLYAPVTMTSRAPTEDTTIPLARPYVDTQGVIRDSIFLPRGVIVNIPVLLINRSKELWGPDAAEWNPHRWLAGTPDAASAVPGVWSHLLTFLGGPHACIGFRFSLMETKVILHAVLSTLQVELAVPADKIGKKSTGIVTRPGVRGHAEDSSQLPMFVSLASGE